jgi:hypothetical protein
MSRNYNHGHFSSTRMPASLMSWGFSSNSCRSLLNPFRSRGRLRGSLRARLREACKFLALASFSGSPYSLDESGVVKCVLKAGCAVGTRMQTADKMSVDLTFDRWNVRHLCPACFVVRPDNSDTNFFLGPAQRCPSMRRLRPPRCPSNRSHWNLLLVAASPEPIPRLMQG